MRDRGYTSSAILDTLKAAVPPHELLTNTTLIALGFYEPDLIEREPLAALGTLFGLGGWIPHTVYERTIPSNVRESLETAGCIARPDKKHVRSTLSIAELDGRLFFADAMLERSATSIRLTQSESDHVDPPNYSSLSLWNQRKQATGRRDAANPKKTTRRLLDVGCGTGFLAIMASEHAEQIVGIDLNPRCIAYAKMNALLNDVEAAFHVENCLEFADERFDEIVFNSPSVPRYKANLEKIDTFPSEFGYKLAFDFVETRLSTHTPGRGRHMLHLEHHRIDGQVCLGRASRRR